MKDFIQEPHTDPSSDNPCSGSIEKDTVPVWTASNTKGGNEVNELAEIREDDVEDFFADLRDLINAYSVDK